MIKNRILDFWFEGYQLQGGKLLPSTHKKWFSPEFDSIIKSEFEDLLSNVYENEKMRKNLQEDAQVSNFVKKREFWHRLYFLTSFQEIYIEDRLKCFNLMLWQGRQRTCFSQVKM